MEVGRGFFRRARARVSILHGTTSKQGGIRLFPLEMWGRTRYSGSDLLRPEAPVNVVSYQAVILAAGKGTRMKSDRTKVMHEVLGRPIIEWVVETALDAGAEHVTVITGHDRHAVEQHLTSLFGERVSFALQAEQLGTGHAVHCAADALRAGPARTVVLSGDVPNLQADTLREFVSATHDATVGLMTARLEDPARYGRIIRAEADDVAAIVEFADADEEQRGIDEVNAGFYAFDTEFLLRELQVLCSAEASNAQGEFYLTDLVGVAARDGGVRAWVLPEVAQMQGVNTRADLASATRDARRRVNERWMRDGVTMVDPDSTFVGARVTLAPDVVLQPGVQLLGATSIASGATIASSCVIEDTEIGPGAVIKPFCHLESARVEAGAQIGPFAHLRPGADIGPRAKVGNFVEVKNVRMDEGAKANHHSYLGDGHVGASSNIGAGTIFCNYDGKNKHRTEIGDGVFIGSNTAIVAPVQIGSGAYVGAGSVITTDVPAEALAVARGRQKNIDGWARRKGR